MAKFCGAKISKYSHLNVKCGFVRRSNLVGTDFNFNVSIRMICVILVVASSPLKKTSPDSPQREFSGSCMSMRMALRLAVTRLRKSGSYIPRLRKMRWSVCAHLI